MDFDLSDDHRLLRSTVREFAEQEIAPVAEELDRTKAFPYELVKRLGELNLMGIPFPEEVGGAGADTMAYAIAVEELARVDSSVAITLCAHTSLGTQPIYLFGSDEQKREWLPRLTAGTMLGAFGLTEPEAGSDAGNVQTRATLDNGDWVVNGAKQFITNAGTDISGFVVITAVTDIDARGRKEISNILVPNGTPGYEQGEPYRKMGWNASDTRPLSFTDCRVPATTSLGPRGAGFKQFLHVLDIGRIGVAAMGVGLAQGALDEALTYARERQAFGQPISKFQAIQGKLADMATEIEAARLLVYNAAGLKDQERDFSLTAAQAKLKTGRLAVRCTEEAVQIHGGYGYIEEYPVCRFYRDAKILTIGEGTDEVQQMVIARALGGVGDDGDAPGPRPSARGRPARRLPERAGDDPDRRQGRAGASGSRRAGVTRLEATSFVRADAIPQLADAAAVLRAVTLPDARLGLGPDPERARARRGARAARRASTRSTSSSPPARRTTAATSTARSPTRSPASTRVVERARAEGLRCQGTIATAVRLPLRGRRRPRARRRAGAARCTAAGCEEIAFGDTTGMANPAQVRTVFPRWAEALPGAELTAHFHNTRGQGLANVLAALDAGVTSFESSFGELGGCPVPAGSTGNVASEDLVSMLHEMGIDDRDRPGEAAGGVARGAGRSSAARSARTC